MAGHRKEKYARMIQKELSEIFQKEMNSVFSGDFVSVTSVEMSPDLGVAKVFVSFALSKDKKASMEVLLNQSSAIRNYLGQRIRKQVRVIPELNFYLDDSVSYALKMENLFKDLNNNNDPK